MARWSGSAGAGHIIVSGLTQGARWGAVLGGTFVAVLCLGAAIESGNADWRILLIGAFLIGSALGPGALVGGVVGVAVAVALVLSGESVRRHRTRTRLVAAGVCAIPAAIVVATERWMASSWAYWTLLVGVAVAMMVAGVVLAPTVAAGGDPRTPAARA